ncbi:hypothetical protein [Fournierella massiliensis]|uniref:hypothetical protein n=1 Tax=Allofournierella massiliensis TaxID=1650663 RepID=UPI0035229D44
MSIKKKIVALGMVCVLAMGITTSAFAYDELMFQDAGNGKYMNIAGTLGTSPEKRYLTLYRTSNLNSDQKFVAMKKRGTTFGGCVLCASQNVRYAMNRNGSTGRAWMWDLTKDGYEDSRLYTIRADAGLALESPNWGSVGVRDNNVYYGVGGNWDITGRPLLPLVYSALPDNPYL